MRLRMKFRLWLGYAAVRAALVVLRPIPFGLARALCVGVMRVYFVLDRDPVGMVGQTVGWVIYARNLMLIRRGA